MELNFPSDIKDDLMFLNTLYHRPTKHNEYTDMLEVVYKIISTGEKEVLSIPNPTMNIYVAKDEYRNTFYREYMPLSQVEKHTFPYKDLEMCIAKLAGENYVKWMYENMRNGNRRANKNIHKWENVYGSDYDIEQWFRIHWMLNHDNDKVKKPTKAYLDIETDIIGLNRFVLPGEVPINAVTIVDEESNSVYTLLLRNSKNPLIEEFEQDIDNFIQELHEMFDETYGVLDYKIYMYDEDKEINMIKDIFNILNVLKPDFVLIWNMDFDIPYILERIKQLRYDPEEVCCHKDFKRKAAYYTKTRDRGVVVNRSSRFVLSGYSTFYCQMTLYAGMRKGQGELPSLKLNAVGKKEIGDEKIDYSDIADISTLPYKNYKLFVVYNIKDVLLQMGIEKKTGDVDNLYMRSYANCISYEKTFKQTKFEEDRAYIEYYRQGLIIGNNVNIDYGMDYEDPDIKNTEDSDEEESFAGGLVADPDLFGYEGFKIFGVPSKHALKNVVDFDFSSMYPWIIITFNISRGTMIGKLLIDTVDTGDSLRYAEDLESNTDKGRLFMEDYLTNHVSMLCSKWFGLPSTEELIIELGDKFNINGGTSLKVTKYDLEHLKDIKITVKG